VARNFDKFFMVGVPRFMGEWAELGSALSPDQMRLEAIQKVGQAALAVSRATKMRLAMSFKFKANLWSFAARLAKPEQRMLVSVPSPIATCLNASRHQRFWKERASAHYSQERH
jgi:hypothetical protein